jgi:WD40 repeat protein
MSRRLVIGVLALALLAVAVAWLRRPDAPQAVEEVAVASAQEVPAGGVAVAEVARAPEPRPVPVLEPIARFGETRLRHPAPVRSLTLSANGTVLATTTSTEPVIRLWDVATARLKGELRIDLDSTIYLTLVGFAPDGRKLIAIRHKLRDPQDSGPRWSEPVTIEVATGATTLWRWGAEGEYYLPAFTIAPDGKTVAGLTQYGEVKIWRLDDGWQLRELGRVGSVSTRSLSGICFSPDSNQVAVCDDQSCVHVAPADGSQPLRKIELDTNRNGVRSVFWPQQDRLIAVWYSGIVALDPATGRQLGRATYQDHNMIVNPRPSGGNLLFAKPDNYEDVAAFDLTTLARVPDRLFLGSARDEPYAASADGKVLAIACGHSVRLFDPATGKSLHPDLDRHPADPVSRFQLSADGTRFLTDGGRSAQTWDLPAGRLLASFDGYGRWPGALLPGLSPDGRRVAGGRLSVWDAETGAVVIPEPKVTDDDKSSPAVIGFAGNDRFWVGDYRANTLAVVARPDGKIDPKGTARFWGQFFATSPDGRRIAASGHGAMAVRGTDPSERWVEVESYLDRLSKQRCGLSPPDCAIPVRFSPDSRLLLTWDNGHVLWDLGRSPIRLGRLSVGYAKEWQRRDAVFSPDSRRIAAVVSERGGAAWIVVWETASASEVFRWSVPGGATACAFTPDGRRLLVAHPDTTLSVWDLAEIEAKEVGADAVTKEAWDHLASPDGRIGFRAVRSLTVAPEITLPILREGFRPPDPAKVARLIAELENEDFEVREKATEALAALGVMVEARLRAAAAGSDSQEVRDRADKVLRSLRPGSPAPTRLRAIRAVEVLERAGTAEAKELLAKWAKDHPGTILGAEAKAAAGRLAAKK